MDAATFVAQLGAANQEILDRLAPAETLVAESGGDLRLETLHAANDAITNVMAALPVFHLYDIQDTLHSSSDGQRRETQIDTINARHSPKYFGLHQGVSAYTLVANHVPHQRQDYRHA